MPWHCRTVSPSPVRRLPSGFCHPLLRLTDHQYLHLLCNQVHAVVWLIAALGPNHQVEITLTSCPDNVIVAALHDCLGLQDIILGKFVLVDISPFEDYPSHLKYYDRLSYHTRTKVAVKISHLHTPDF